MQFTGYSQVNVITNTDAGALEMRGDWNVQQVNPGAWPPVQFGLLNNGTLRKTGGGAVVLDAVPLASHGQCEVTDGVLRVNNNLTLGPTSELTLGVGPEPSLIVRDRATLAGRLGGQPVQGYLPPVGTPHPVLQAGSLIGAFENEVALSPGHFLVYEVAYAGNGIVFTPRSVLGDPVHLAQPQLVGNTLTLTADVPEGLHVLIESSVDLLEWRLEATVTASGGQFVWSAPPSSSEPYRFFRTRLLP